MLKKLFLLIVKEYFFWLAFFFICRAVFLLYNTGELNGIPFFEALAAFPNAVYLDTSMACYFLSVSFLFFALYGFFYTEFFLKLNRIYAALIIFIFSSIVISELKIYDEWGTKLNIKAVSFLEQPAEVINSTPAAFLIFGLIAIGLLTFAGIYLHKKFSAFFHKAFAPTTSLPFSKRWTGAVVFLLTVPFLIGIGIRGGLQQIPIQQSDAYFSRHNVLNLAAVNSGWNLGQSFMENRMHLKGNPYIYFTAEEAAENARKLHAVEKDSTLSFLKTNRPNIVMVILEGWSADMVRSLGGFEGASNGFDALTKEGILFDSIYASGGLSDQGMTAIFSGFPALPAGISIIGQPSKYGKLPCMAKEFQKAGYKTSFLFGGQLSYGNIKAYMYFNNFDRIIEGNDFSDDVPRGKLCIHDEFVYSRQLEELKKESEPFFAALFTGSSHSPYDMPFPRKINWGGDEMKYANSIAYADSCLFDFVRRAKNENWFDSTLFVFVADHSHRSPRGWTPHQPEYRRIPMLFWGNVIKEEFRGWRYKKVCSQVDIASTLLNQLGLKAGEFQWSKNLFNPNTAEFAYYETRDGFGFVRSGQYIVYSHTENKFHYEKVRSQQEKAKMETEGKSYLQTVFQQFTDY